MIDKLKFYLVEFQEEVCQFTKAMSIPELPTIDVDMAVAQVCEVFQRKDTLSQMELMAAKLASSDWLIEHSAWDTPEEERAIRVYIFRALLHLGREMFYKLHSVGMYPKSTETYIRRRSINDFTIAFSQLT